MKKKLLFLVPFLAMVMSGCSSPVTPTSSGQPTSAPTTEPGPTTGTETSESTSPTSESTDTTVTPTSESSDPTTVPTSESSDPTTVPTSESSTGTTPTTQSTSEVPTPVDVTKVNISSGYSASILVNGTHQIEASVSPADATDKALIYTSLNPTVASVSDAGLVKGLAPGVATIVVTSHQFPDATENDLRKTISIDVSTEGFVYPTMTTDGYSIASETNPIQDGDDLYIAAYFGENAYLSNAASATDGFAAGSIEEGDLVVPSAATMYKAIVDDGKIILQNGEKYVKAQSGKYALVNTLEEATPLSVTYDEDNSALLGLTIGSDDYLYRFNYNGGNCYFRFYKTSSSVKTPVVLYRKALVVLSGIEITEGPTKTDYFVGDYLDLTGMKVNKVYSDLHKEEALEEEYTVSLTDRTLEASDTEFVVTLKDDPTMTASKAITVTPVQLDSITYEDVPGGKTSYVLGESFDKNSIEVTAHYNDVRKDKELSPEEYNVSPASFTEAGEEVEVTISYTEGLNTKTATKIVEVVNKEIESIELVGEPTKTVYYAGESFDKSTVTVKAIYNDESTDDNYTGYSVTPEGALAEGDEIVLSVGLLTIDLSDKITVVADEVNSISVASDSEHKSSFNAGEEFSSAGLKLDVEMKSGLHNVATTGFTTDFDGVTFDAEDIGELTVTVSYVNESSCEYPITVNDAIESISIKTPASKLSFKVGETFSAAGLVLTTTSYGGVAGEASEGYTTDLDGYEFLAEDVAEGKTVTVSYAGKTTSYHVDVELNGVVANGRYVVSTIYNETTYYVSSELGSSNQPLATTDESKALALSFELVGNNEYTIKNGSDYMYCTSTNNGVKFKSETPDKNWTVSFDEVSSTYSFHYTPDEERVFSLYTKDNAGVDYRCYKASGTDGVRGMLLTPVVDVASVTLDQSEIALELGGSDTTLNATVLPEDATVKGVRWSSSDETVATVENGVVHPVGLGNAVITVTTVDGSKTDTCDVTVQRPALTAFVLDPAEPEMGTNSTLEISVSPDPSDAELPEDTQLGCNVASGIINYSYSDGVISITSGATAGTAEFTLFSTSTHVNKTFEVEVVSGDIPVNSIILSDSTKSLVVGDDFVLSHTVGPEGATDKSVTYSVTSGSEYASVSYTEGAASATVTALAAGTATITCTSVSTPSISASCTVEVREKITQFTKVTNVADLHDGDDILILNEDATVALGAQSGNNCPAKEVTVVDDVVTNVGEASVLTLEQQSGDNNFALKTREGKYLYAAGSDKNYLKVQDNVNANAIFNFSINDGEMKIYASESSNRNIIRYNGTNTPPVFSCYGSGQAAVRAYKVDGTYVPVLSGISLNKTEATMSKDGGTVDLVATLSPAGVEGTITWEITSGDFLASLSSASGANVTVSANGSGTGTVTVEATCGDFTASCEITINESPAAKSYTLTITGNNFTSTSYTDSTITVNAIASDSSTFAVELSFTQILKSGSNMQFKKTGSGKIYNTTNLGYIDSVTLSGDSVSMFDTFYGDSENPSSGTTTEKPYFATKTNSGSSGTIKLSSIVIVFHF